MEQNKLVESIITYIKKHPGCRKREIAGSLHIWQCDTRFLHAMGELERYGVIKSVIYRDPAQMEYYDKWYIVNN